MRRLALLVALIALMATPTFAQARRRGPQLNKSEIERIIKRLENNTDAFERAVDRQLDRSVLDGTRAEDRINNRIDDLEDATDRLRSRFDRSDSFNETRGDVENVLRVGRDIDALFDRVRAYSRVRYAWATVRSDINTLARVYRLRGLR